MLYSEHEEEQYILEAVSDLETGNFVDVGAYDGITFSNTRALVERGWSGVMIEPGLSAFQKLLKNYSDSEKVQLVHAAVEPYGDTDHLVYGGQILANSRGCSHLQQFRENPDTYSTACDSNYERFKAHYSFSRQFWIPTIEWGLLINWLAVAQVISIDTEGSSVDLLLQLPFEYVRAGKNVVRPRVIVVEHDERFATCRLAVERYGYREIHRNKVNLIFKCDHV